MKIVVAGGSGFLGRPLVQALSTARHDIVVLSRGGGTSVDGARAATWAPDGRSGPWSREVEGADAVINLAGEPLPERRWTESHKRRILDSRVLATRSLVEACGTAAAPPRIFISASGIGYYPNSDAITDESAPAGVGFLSRVCELWEAEARRVETTGARVVLLRTGVVLHREGGAIQKLLLPFKLGVGGPIGSGRQWWAWIHRADWIAMTMWALNTAGVSGPLNVCAPEPSQNKDVMRALGRAVRRPALVPTPAFALRAAFGEMADEMLLASQRAVPKRALDGGFSWTLPALQQAVDAAVRGLP